MEGEGQVWRMSVGGGWRVVVWKTVTARVTKLSKLNLGHLNDQKYIRPGGM